MQKLEKIEYGNFYHIYNHAVGGRNVFKDSENYEHFLHLYDIYIEPIAETFAWALMPNHFHFLVRIKKDICYKYSNADRSIDAVRFSEIKWQTTDLSASEGPDSVKIPKPEKHFSHLFNSYTKYYNARHESVGAMFERPFKRKHISNIPLLKNTVLYIHNNPVHHGFCDHQLEYPWTSYLSCISFKPTKLKRDEVIGWFNEKGQFETNHNEGINWIEFESWLGI